MEKCPCGNALDYEACCGPFHSGALLPPTAEALMRSRYCAYVKSDIDYLIRTLQPEKRTSQDRKAARAWAEGTEWLGLQILNARGGLTDKQGQVEFIARYRQGEREQSHHEISVFKKLGDRWFFSDGKVVSEIPPDAHISRNALCPCGSGKKFKLCCAAS